MLQVFELAKTDLRGASYDIICKHRQENHKIGNFVLGHRTSVGSQGLQCQVIKLVSETHSTQEARMQDLNLSKRRSGGQIMCFGGKKWPILVPQMGSIVSRLLSHRH